MSNGSKVKISERFSKLRKLRDSLCSKDSTDNWREAFQARDWVVSELNELKSLANQSNADVNKIREKIDSIMSVFETDYCAEKGNGKR